MSGTQSGRPGFVSCLLPYQASLPLLHSKGIHSSATACEPRGDTRSCIPFYPLLHMFPTFSKISLTVHFTPVCMKNAIVTNGALRGARRESGSRSGPPFCPCPAGGWPPLLELEMRKEVAFVQPWSLSDAFVTNCWGPCACHALTHVSGARHPTVLTHVLPVSGAVSAAGENICFPLGKSK